MQIIIDIILPIFAIILCGYIAGRTEVISASGSKTLNSYVFFVALPALLFYAVANAPISQLTNWNFLFANLLGILSSFFLTILFIRLFLKKKSAVLSIYGMNASYGTTGYMGLPLLIAAFGDKAALPAALATLIHNIPVIATVIVTFEWVRAKENRHEKGLFYFLQDVIKPVLFHPITLSVLLGITFSLFNITLPKSLDIFASFLSDAAGPTALFAIGLGLTNQKELLKWSSLVNKEVHFLLFMKLGFQPTITLLLVFFVFELEPLWALTTILMSALPIGAGVFVFAQKYDNLTQETSTGIVLSLLLSVLTISILFIYLIEHYSISIGG
ncbi:AEC family transporter [Pseudogracilibacillus auburnensis]|uniref:AEC family transporter n=1 Tax=Pseudogracilibacillus auburnensis TaxID=1494959 RepID=UPI001A977459|nr:AEC family transporter [Pseudogracilibacillus auburnensis]MBO1001158.1 AEC family transporter [Pseudogracilibacillus auburnensis]